MKRLAHEGGAALEAMKRSRLGLVRAATVKEFRQCVTAGGSYWPATSLEEAVQDVKRLSPFMRDILHSSMLNCTKTKDLSAVRQLWSTILARGLVSDIFLANTVLRLFASCGSLDEANAVFCAISRPNLHTWQGIIAAHVSYGRGEQAIKLYEVMRQSGVKANSHIYVAVLKACAITKALHEGRDVHVHAAEAGWEAHLYVASSLIDMYFKCGSFDEAQSLFAKLPRKDVVTWSAMVSGYAKQGFQEHAVRVFQQMQHEGVRANVYVSSIVVDMLTRGGELGKAREAFDGLHEKNVVLWTAMIAGYSRQGHAGEALRLYRQMQCEGVEPNKITFICALQACGSMKALDEGRDIHCQLVDSRLELDTDVGNCLIDMYAKCGSANNARETFDRLVTKDVVSWNSMLAAYIHSDDGREVLLQFCRMQQAGMEPNVVTCLTVLEACGNLTALDQGRELHSYLRAQGLDLDVCVASSLVDMYSKCGSLDDARKVFEKSPEKDVISWSAMIGACGQHGCGAEALQLFCKMQQEGIKPNSATFVCVLSACSQAGLLSEACTIFRTMISEYGILPDKKHFGCLIDLLGRQGYLHEANELIRMFPSKLDTPEVWTSMLGACQTHGKVDLARISFRWIVMLEPTNSAAYTIMSNIYASVGRREDEIEIRKRMRTAGVTKLCGKSWIAVNLEIHSFVSEDATHPVRAEINSHLKLLTKGLRHF